jgi:hypothetical protein
MGARGQGVKDFLNQQAKRRARDARALAAPSPGSHGSLVFVRGCKSVPGRARARSQAWWACPHPLHHAGAALASGDADDPLVESCREEFVGATTVRAFRAIPVGIESHPEQLKRKGAHRRPHIRRL